ncbi:MAG: phosphotransferase [Prevotella sp.]|nr:phosphotransferase [Prevotella sp.]
MIQQLYRSWSGHEPASIEKLPGAGSNRQYWRLTDAAGSSVIACLGTSREENHAFVYLSRHFRQRQLPMPRLLAVSDDEMAYLQEDLGRRSLFDALQQGRDSGGRYSEAEVALLTATIRQLPRVQVAGAVGLDWQQCYPTAVMDAESVMMDLNYFKYCFLKPSGTDFNEHRLQADFVRLCRDLCRTDEMQGFLYRDFQARNVMLTDSGEPRFIDYQGGRRGPVYYDVASFLWQASARYPDALRRQLVDVYYDALRHTVAQVAATLAAGDSSCGPQGLPACPPRSEFDGRLSLFVLFRTPQVLGAYGFRGYFERKQHFIDSIPPALDNLRQLLHSGVVAPYPVLHAVLQSLCVSSSPTGKTLVVRVFSFSYKRGLPTDDSGNGGGYVFDCRSTHNPGRYAEYKELTGLDQPVIHFLEADGEITTFLESVYRLADHHVERYLERGFQHLMFSFGCTGGQHRSVYCAQHLAEHLHRNYGIRIELCHREQGICQTMPAQG